MTKVRGNHRDLNIRTGDTVEVNNGPIGTVRAVHPKFSEDGIYGKLATYQVETDDGSKVWVQDYKITAVEYS